MALSSSDTSAAQEDAAILAGLRQGDEQVFAQVVDAWSPGMLRLARCHVTTDASAEEVVQDAWIGVLRGLGGFEGRSRVRTWVLRIVVNIAKTRGQQEHRVRPFSSVTESDEPTVDPDRFQSAGEPHPGGWRVFPPEWPTLPEGAMLSAEINDVVRAALSSLPQAQRAVMELRDIHGYEAAEVCDALNLSDGNQRVLLHRARAAVRQRRESYFIEHTPTAPAGN
jgi:RNA polymerase sigma-70 factor (ECF subfamily)